MPDNRDWASLTWLGIALVWVLWRRDIRSGFGDVLRTALSPSILMPVGGMLGYVAFEVWLGFKLSLWRSDLAKGTFIWLATSALVLLFSFDKAAKELHFFRRGVIGAFRIAVFLEFFMNLSVLSLAIELLLQPIMAVLVALGSWAVTIAIAV